MADHEAGHSGGCLCGATRYRLAAYSDAGFCHCGQCRRFTGAPVAAWARAAAGDLRIEGAVPAVYGGRRFCAICGSSLYREAGGEVFVQLGTLDDPAAIAPAFHQCAADQLPWLYLHPLPYRDDAAITPPGDRQAIHAPADPVVVRSCAVTLQPVTRDNLRDVLMSDVGAHQRRFVAMNAVSVAQACMEGDVWQRAICAGDVVVGFTMAAIFEEDELGLPWKGDANLWRFMIDRRYQRLGFGARALRMIIDELRTWDGVRNIWLGAVPGAGSPYDLYRRFGFEDTGVKDGDEAVMRLPVRA